MHQGISRAVLQHVVVLNVCAVFVQTICFDVADVGPEGSKDQHIFIPGSEVVHMQAPRTIVHYHPSRRRYSNCVGHIQRCANKTRSCWSTGALSVPLHVDKLSASCSFDPGTMDIQ